VRRLEVVPRAGAEYKPPGAVAPGVPSLATILGDLVVALAAFLLGVAVGAALV